MSGRCSLCQHPKRAEIDRRLAAGEPGNQVARDYDVASSSLHRHRSNCLRLASSNAIMKDVARGTVALASLPSKDELNHGYATISQQIGEIIADAKRQGSLSVALKGLGALKQTLDSQMRLAGHDRPIDTQINVAIQNNVNIEVRDLAQRLIAKFDRDPELKGRSRKHCWRSTMTLPREVAYRLDPAAWVHHELGVAPKPWQAQFLRAPHGASIAILASRQCGKTTTAAVGALPTPHDVHDRNSLSVVGCPTQRQSAEAVRRVKDVLVQATDQAHDR